MPPGIQRSRAKHLLQVLPTGMNELGVGTDLIYLALGAVAPHIRLFENLVEGGVLIYAMDDVAKNFLFPLGPTRVTPKEELAQQGVLLGHRCSSSTLRSSTKTSIHSPLLVEMSEWTETTSAPVCLRTMSSRFGRPASRTCWRIALMSLRPSWVSASRFSAGVSTPKLRTITRSSTIRVLIRSGPRPTNACWKAITSSLTAASALLCRRGVAVFICPAHLLRGCANDEGRWRTAPLNP